MHCFSALPCLDICLLKVCNMPKYKCVNNNCPNCGKEVTCNKSVTKFVKGELIDSASICQFCMEPMEVLRPGEGFTTFMHGSENICKK